MAYNQEFASLLSRLSTVMGHIGEPMRAKAYKTAEETILGMTTEIRDIKDLDNKPGIGSTIKQKLQEYLETGKIAALEKAENKPEVLFTNVYGIGPKKASEIVKKGITTIEQLKARQDDTLNAVQKTGLRYYDDILKRIPRSEIDLYDNSFKSLLKSRQTKYEIVGSYRRGQESSGDIDVIISSESPKAFDDFLDILIGKKIIVEVLSRGKNKCLVIAKIPKSTVYRRVDFLYATPSEFPFSILYFTGSKGFNVVMRGHALKRGYSMNEHGFTPAVNREFKDERAIFDFLGLQYKNPQERVDGRAVVIANSQSHIGQEQESKEESKEEKKKNSRKKKEKVSKNESKKKSKSISIVPENVSIEPSFDSNEILSRVIAQEEIVKTKISRKKREPIEKKPKNKSQKNDKPEPESQAKIKIEEIKESVQKENEEIEKIKTKIEEIKQKTKMENLPKEKQRKLNNIKEIKASYHKIKHMELITKFKEEGIKVLENLSEIVLNEIIDEANDAYYNENPVLTDNEFDIIKEYTDKKFPKAASLCKVGAPVRGSKVTLPFEMASMDKIKPDSGALDAWTVKYKGPYVLSCKLDGVSGLYIHSKTTSGQHKLYTRGNGCVGQDISHLIPILKLPDIPVGMAVRGEFVLSKRVFSDKYSTEFANARNLVSGIINRKSVDEKANDLHFVTYEVIEPKLKPSAQLKMLADTGFRVVQNKSVKSLTNKFLSDLLLDWRSSYDYDIDGVIVTDDAIHPRVSGNPEHAFAFKMVLSDQLAEAKVVDVLWEASKDGYLKPRVRIEPIQLGGVKIEYATGFNGKFIEDNNIGIGAVIQMVRSGDVIPYIKSVTTPAEKPKMPLVPYIWNKTHVDVLLENPNDDEGVQEKNITVFFTTLEVDGLGKGNVHKIYQSGKKTIAEIIKMTAADFEKVEGFKKKTADKLAEGIHARIQQASLIDIMVASGKLGRGLGERKLKPILSAFPDILTEPIPLSQKEAKLKTIPGIGPENAVAFSKNIPDFLAFLKECGLEDKLTEPQKTLKEGVKDDSNQSIVEGPLTGKKIVMTKVRDKDIISFVTSQGGFLEDTMKKDIFTLVVKSKTDSSNKIEYAKTNNIPIMTVEEFKSAYINK
jgi:NAD-dependent DNA ligase